MSKLDGMKQSVLRADSLLDLFRATNEIERAMRRVRTRDDRETLLYHVDGVLAVAVVRADFLCGRLHDFRKRLEVR